MKTKIFILRASLSHPNRMFRIQKHVIGAEFDMYELNEAEQKELAGPGGKKWVEQGTEADYAEGEKRRKKLAKLKAETKKEDEEFNADVGNGDEGSEE